MVDQEHAEHINAAGCPLDWLTRDIDRVFVPWQDEIWVVRDGVCVMRIFNIGERSAEDKERDV